MDCPTCGCSMDVQRVDRVDDVPALAECPCCETVWITSGEGIDQILIGPEG